MSSSCFVSDWSSGNMCTVFVRCSFCLMELLHTTQLRCCSSGWFKNVNKCGYYTFELDCPVLTFKSSVPLIKYIVCTEKRVFPLQINKSFFLWFCRVLQELMRNCVATTCMQPCRLHSCTEPMETTRLPASRCSPTAYYIVS